MNGNGTAALMAISAHCVMSEDCPCGSWKLASTSPGEAELPRTALKLNVDPMALDALLSSIINMA
jgi:hypothetical protein